jgi:hypothetical protein
MQSFAKVPNSARRATNVRRPPGVARSIARRPLVMRSACACGGTCPHCAGEQIDRLQPKLAVNEPGDAYEQEADRIADAVMRTPDADPAQPDPNLATGMLQRKESAAPAGQAGPAIPSGLGVQDDGTPLRDSDRDFFEPRFGRSFSDVRIHTGDKASAAAQAVSARAFTYGNAIVMGESAYAPGTQTGRALLAHELVHVMQQDADGDRSIRRQTINPDCSGHEDVLNEAWAKGLEITEQTIESLDTARQAIGMQDFGGVPLRLATAITNTFGDVGLQPGMTMLPDLIKQYEKIRDAFKAGRSLRCNISNVNVDQDECQQYDAFVIPGNSTDVFICPSFFGDDKNPVGRGVTFLHELAHSALHIGHMGGVVQNFDCGSALGFAYDIAKRNAYAYDILANCLHGEGTKAMEVTGNTPAAPPAKEAPRWALSAAIGAGLTPGVPQFAAALGGQVSLRTGEYVVFNPVIGFNLLTLPSTDNNSSTLAAATADIGLRIQQPLEGFYADVSAGGWAGFDINAGRDPAAQFTGGPTAAAGLGWRWQRLELGAQARALVPETDFDRTKLVVLGRAALLFP